MEAQPPQARPKVAILRRTLRVLDAQPARRYEEIRSFVDVGYIERAEAALKVQVESVSQQRNAAVAVIVENEDQLSRFWQAAGSPGVDHVQWAREETQREREDPVPIVTAIETANARYVAAKGNFERYEQGLARLEVADEAVAAAQRLLAAATDAEAAGAPDTLGLLEAAEEYLAHDHQNPAECPLCGSPDRAAGLLSRVRDRIGSMQALQGALRQHTQAQIVREAASAALAAIEGDYENPAEKLSSPRQPVIGRSTPPPRRFLSRHLMLLMFLPGLSNARRCSKRGRPSGLGSKTRVSFSPRCGRLSTTTTATLQNKQTSRHLTQTAVGPRNCPH